MREVRRRENEIKDFTVFKGQDQDVNPIFGHYDLDTIHNLDVFKIIQTTPQ